MEEGARRPRPTPDGLLAVQNHLPGEALDLCGTKPVVAEGGKPSPESIGRMIARVRWCARELAGGSKNSGVL